MTAAFSEASPADVTTLLSHYADSGCTKGIVGIRAQAHWSHGNSVLWRGKSVPVRTASTMFALRDALGLRHEHDWVVVLSDIDERLPVGVQEHLLGRALTGLDPGLVLRTLFGAHTQDAGLLPSNESVREAIETLSGNEVAPVDAGRLTDRALFAALAQFGLRMPAELSLPNVLAWAISIQDSELGTSWFLGLSSEMKAWISRHLADVLAPRLGYSSPQFVKVLARRGPTELVAIGLILALFDQDSPQMVTSGASSSSTLVAAQARLEGVLDLPSLPTQLRESWSVAAENLIKDTLNRGKSNVTQSRAREVLSLASSLVKKHGLSDLVARSDVLKDALAARADTFVSAAAACRDGNGQLSQVDLALSLLGEHISTTKGSSWEREFNSAQAIARVMRWLALPVPTPGPNGWMELHRNETSWVDACVNAMWWPTSHVGLTNLATEIGERARARRAKIDAEFAASRLASLASSSSMGTELPIERVLDEVVAPLIAPRNGFLQSNERPPVLMVVLDGMSATASNSLVSDITTRTSDWREMKLVSDTDHRLRSAIAVLPSVTEFSRTSLMCGTLVSGNQNSERKGLRKWLEAKGIRSDLDVSFHKNRLDAQGASTDHEIRAAIEDTTDRPLVTCTINIIDDSLAKSDAIEANWNLERIPHLQQLLNMAASVGRTVLLVSDHGHVVERSKKPKVQAEGVAGARWLRGQATPPDSPVASVHGDRVLAEGGSALLAVDEETRFTGKQAGYHGGGTLAELCIPISILSTSADSERLELVFFAEPEWWNPLPESLAPTITSAERSAKPPKTKKRVMEIESDAMMLFDTITSDTGSLQLETSNARNSRSSLHQTISELVRNEIYRKQFAIYGKPISEDLAAKVLDALAKSNGTVDITVPAKILGVNPLKARQPLASIARVVNYDGVTVLSMEGSQVSLDLALLREQFEVI